MFIDDVLVFLVNLLETLDFDFQGTKRRPKRTYATSVDDISND